MNPQKKMRNDMGSEKFDLLILISMIVWSITIFLYQIAVKNFNYYRNCRVDDWSLLFKYKVGFVTHIL